MCQTELPILRPFHRNRLSLCGVESVGIVMDIDIQIIRGGIVARRAVLEQNILYGNRTFVALMRRSVLIPVV